MVLYFHFQRVYEDDDSDAEEETKKAEASPTKLDEHYTVHSLYDPNINFQ